MKTIMRPRYYCEFCTKSSGSAPHIKRHEAGCTLNPNRVCGLCREMGNDQPAMGNLLEVLRGFTPIEEDASAKRWVAERLPKLREVANKCPACIMAALRQTGIPVPLAEGFDYAKEHAEWWSIVNDAKATAELERERYGYG